MKTIDIGQIIGYFVIVLCVISIFYLSYKDWKIETHNKNHWKNYQKRKQAKYSVHILHSYDCVVFNTISEFTFVHKETAIEYLQKKYKNALHDGWKFVPDQYYLGQEQPFERLYRYDFINGTQYVKIYFKELNT